MGVPVGVLSNNDGCFVARTPELKALGVKMGDPYFKVKDIIRANNVQVFSSNFALYTNISDRVMNTLKGFSPEVEVYSVDEAFIRLTGIRGAFREEFGWEIKRKVERNTGIPVSVGIGRTKVLAKVANHTAKKNPKYKGVCALSNPKIEKTVLEQLKIEDLWGVGRANSVKFRAIGVQNALALRDFPNDKVIKKTFTKVGLQMKEELCGLPRFPLELETKKKKQIMHSRSFGKVVKSKDGLKQAVSRFIHNAMEKLRRQNSVCSQISVFARSDVFKETNPTFHYHQYKHVEETSDTRAFLKAGLSIVDRFYQQGVAYKKAGVMLSGIRDKELQQLSLFKSEVSEESDLLMCAMDAFNSRDGEGTIHFASSGTTVGPHKMNRNHLSPRYVTGWSHLRKVR